jgi:hypothetical protein
LHFEAGHRLSIISSRCASSASPGISGGPNAARACRTSIVPNDKANAPGKLADAELHFTDGELDGLKLIGFAV